MKTFFLLLCMHALTDFQLQNGMMWQYKMRGCDPHWWHWLTAHALICGGGVYVVTQCLWLAVVEVICHWLLDFLKGEKWISFQTDQLLHICCRIMYATILWGAVDG